MPRRGLLTLTLSAALASLAACAPQQPTYVLTQSTVAPAPVACNSAFRVANASSGTVERLYFSHASLGSWGADQLGERVLPPGRNTGYRAANAGAYDFRVVWANGRASELRGVDICRASLITVTDHGLRAS